MKTKRQILEEERRAKRKADNRKIQRWLDDNGIPTTVDRLNEYDRMTLLDRLRD